MICNDDFSTVSNSTAQQTMNKKFTFEVLTVSFERIHSDYGSYHAAIFLLMRE